MTRLAIVIDTRSPPPSLGELLEALERERGLRPALLVMPAADANVLPSEARLAGAVASRLADLERSCARLAARLRPDLARRIGFRDPCASDGRSRFERVVELPADDGPALDVRPDLVLVFGQWLPRPVLDACPPTAAILQVELGSHPEQGLGLAGFEECWSGTDCTPVRLSRVHAADGSREVLVEGRNRTKRILSLNQAAAWDRASSILLAQLASPVGLAGTPGRARAEARRPEPTPSSASLARLAAYPLRLAGRAGRLVVHLLAGRRRWTVAIYPNAAPDRRAGPPADVEAAPAGTYHADPILYRDPGSGRAYCFVEEVDMALDRGHIAVLSESGGRWRREGVALAEPFHLSFPFLFRFDGALFMCPEAGQSGEIRVYRCTSLPLGWELEAVLMRDVSATDTMLFPHAGRWWMLTNLDRGARPDHQSELHVFHADSPLATDWQPVAGNPVKVDCRGGRNGGLEVVDGRIFRFGQVQGFDAYGQGLNRYEITRLDVGSYEEELRESIAPPAGTRASGLHTLSVIDGWMAVDLLGASHARRTQHPSQVATSGAPRARP